MYKIEKKTQSLLSRVRIRPWRACMDIFVSYLRNAGRFTRTGQLKLKTIASGKRIIYIFFVSLKNPGRPANVEKSGMTKRS